MGEGSCSGRVHVLVSGHILLRVEPYSGFGAVWGGGRS